MAKKIYTATFLENGRHHAIWHPEVGEVPTKRSSDHDPMIRHCRIIECRIIGRFDLRRKIVG
jgi:hypothetical protein